MVSFFVRVRVYGIIGSGLGLSRQNLLNAILKYMLLSTTADMAVGKVNASKMEVCNCMSTRNWTRQ